MTVSNVPSRGTTSSKRYSRRSGLVIVAAEPGIGLLLHFISGVDKEEATRPCFKYRLPRTPV